MTVVFLCFFGNFLWRIINWFFSTYLLPFNNRFNSIQAKIWSGIDSRTLILWKRGTSRKENFSKCMFLLVRQLCNIENNNISKYTSLNFHNIVFTTTHESEIFVTLMYKLSPFLVKDALDKSNFRSY